MRTEYLFLSIMELSLVLIRFRSSPPSSFRVCVDSSSIDGFRLSSFEWSSSLSYSSLNVEKKGLGSCRIDLSSNRRRDESVNSEFCWVDASFLRPLWDISSLKYGDFSVLCFSLAVVYIFWNIFLKSWIFLFLLSWNLSFSIDLVHWWTPVLMILRRLLLLISRSSSSFWISSFCNSVRWLIIWELELLVVCKRPHDWCLAKDSPLLSWVIFLSNTSEGINGRSKLFGKFLASLFYSAGFAAVLCHFLPEWCWAASSFKSSFWMKSFPSLKWNCIFFFDSSPYSSSKCVKYPSFRLNAAVFYFSFFPLSGLLKSFLSYGFSATASKNCYPNILRYSWWKSL